MTQPGPDEVSTPDELLDAVLRLLGTSDDRAVERRAGVSKTTVNEVRNRRRRLSAKTLSLLVEAYDPTRADEWVDAWLRLNPKRPTPTGSAARPPAAATETPAPAAPAARAAPVDSAAIPASAGTAPFPASTVPPDSATPPEDSATTPGSAPPPHSATTPGSPDSRSGAASSFVLAPDPAPTAPAIAGRAAHLLVGSALLAAVAAVIAMVLVLTSSEAPIVLESPGPASPPSLPGTVPMPGLVGAGAAAPVGGPGPPPGSGPIPPPQGDIPPASGCPASRLPLSARVVDGPGSAASGLRVTAGFYSHDKAPNPLVELGGRLSGRPGPGQVLIGASWADPETRDSTPAGNRGDGRYYPGRMLPLTDQNCFAVAPYNIGYSGYAGITTHIHVLLTDASQVPALLQRARQNRGLEAPDLADLGAQDLGHLVIPS